MDEVGYGMQKQRWGVFAGILVGLIILYKLRQRRKMKKLLRMRARARTDKTRGKEATARAKAVTKIKKAPKKEAKKKKKKTFTQKLIRFVAFRIIKKVISKQIKQLELDLGRDKLGKRLVDETES